MSGATRLLIMPALAKPYNDVRVVIGGCPGLDVAVLCDVHKFLLHTSNIANGLAGVNYSACASAPPLLLGSAEEGSYTQAWPRRANRTSAHNQRLPH